MTSKQRKKASASAAERLWGAKRRSAGFAVDLMVKMPTRGSSRLSRALDRQPTSLLCDGVILPLKCDETHRDGI
jgi:hypothetical protein